MEERAHALIAIVFLAVFGVGAGLVAWWMMAPSVSRVPYVLEAQGSVAGLGPGSPVSYHGVQVGAVRKVGLDPQNRRHINVRIAVNTNFPLPEGTYATIAAPGLIGSKSVELTLGSGSKDIQTSVQSPAHLPLKPGAMSGLVQNASEIMDSLKATLKSIHGLLNKQNRDHISATLAQIDEASAHLVQLEKDAAPALKQMPGLIAQVHDTLGAARKVLVQAKTLVSEAHEPVRAVGRAASAVSGLAAQMNQTTLPGLNALLARLRSLSARLQTLVDTLQRTPQSLITGPAPVPAGPGETKGTPSSGGG